LFFGEIGSAGAGGMCVGGQRKGVLEIKVEKIELGAGWRRYHIRVRVAVTTRFNP